ncbi:hypothetical protein ES705_44677 [subsurface metagenome]
MGKKVFTRDFTATIPVEGAVDVRHEPYTYWKLQEDIEVLGVELNIQNELPSENDGFAKCYAEISQAGFLFTDGVIACCSASEGWNTAPPGISETNGHVTVMLPQGSVITVKEEGYLYLNIASFGKTAGISGFRVEGIVYYTKPGYRSK